MGPWSTGYPPQYSSIPPRPPDVGNLARPPVSDQPWFSSQYQSVQYSSPQQVQFASVDPYLPPTWKAVHDGYPYQQQHPSSPPPPTLSVAQQHHHHDHEGEWHSNTLGYYQPSSSQPSPHPPPSQHSPSAVIVNGHLLPHQFPCGSQIHSPNQLQTNQNQWVPPPQATHVFSSPSLYPPQLPPPYPAHHHLPQSYPRQLLDWECGAPNQLCLVKERKLCSVSDGTSISNQFNILNNDCGVVNSVCAAKFGGIGANFDNEKKESCDKRIETNNGERREFKELENISAKKDEQRLSSCVKSREHHAPHLSDEMPKSNGECNAGCGSSRSGNALLQSQSTSKSNLRARSLFQPLRLKKKVTLWNGRRFSKLETVNSCANLVSVKKRSEKHVQATTDKLENNSRHVKDGDDIKSISHVMISGSKCEDNESIGMIDKVNTVSNTKGVGMEIRESEIQSTEGINSVIWKNKGQSLCFLCTSFDDEYSVENTLLGSEAPTPGDVDNNILNGNVVKANAYVGDSYEKMQVNSKRVLEVVLENDIEYAQKHSNLTSYIDLGSLASISNQNDFGSSATQGTTAAQLPLLATSPIGMPHMMHPMSVGCGGTTPSVRYGIPNMPVMPLNGVTYYKSELSTLEMFACLVKNKNLVCETIMNGASCIRIEHYTEDPRKISHYTLLLCFSGYDKKVRDKGSGDILLTNGHFVMKRDLEGNMRLLLPNEECLGYILCTLDAPHIKQQLGFKLNYQNVLQLLSSYNSVFVMSWELLQTENQIDHVDAKAFASAIIQLHFNKASELTLTNDMRVSYSLYSFLEDQVIFGGVSYEGRDEPYELQDLLCACLQVVIQKRRVTLTVQINRVASIGLKFCPENMHKWGWYNSWKVGQKLIHLALVLNFALKSLLHPLCEEYSALDSHSLDFVIALSGKNVHASTLEGKMVLYFTLSTYCPKLVEIYEESSFLGYVANQTYKLLHALIFDTSLGGNLDDEAEHQLGY